MLYYETLFDDFSLYTKNENSAFISGPGSMNEYTASEALFTKPIA